jgi:hypothetical protein
MDAANQQAKGITGGEPFQDLDYLPDLGGVHRAALPAVCARNRLALSWCRCSPRRAYISVVFWQCAFELLTDLFERML